VARRWAAALSCCWGLVAPGTSAGEEWSPGAGLAQGEAVLVGSSSFEQSFGHLIEGELQRWGYQVTRQGVSGAGLARPDFRDLSQVLETLPIGTSTAAVFVYVGVNDAQPLWLYPEEREAYGVTFLPFGSAAWDSVYARRTRDFYDRICQRGAQRAFVLLPVDVNRADLNRRLERIRNVQVQAAARSSCAVALTTSGDLGNFEVDGVAKRMPDGFHMSLLGARIVWERVRDQVVRLLSEPRQNG
jgi:hypothetical protein